MTKTTKSYDPNSLDNPVVYEACATVDEILSDIVSLKSDLEKASDEDERHMLLDELLFLTECLSQRLNEIL